MENETENLKDIVHELIIVGSGPAGLTAGIYASRANLKPLILAGLTWGGQLMNTTDVENYPGFPKGVPGPELMQKMMQQAKRFGSRIKYDNVTEVNIKEDIKIVKTEKDYYKAKSIIFATGSNPKRLGIPGEDHYYGSGVSICATCDGAFYKDKTVAVVGGGDTSMEESTFLTRFAQKVYIIHRRDEFRASKIMIDRALANEKIEVVWNTEVREIFGEQTVKKIKIFNNKENSESELEIDGLFLAIGHIPSTQFLTNILELDENGYVKTHNDVETNIPGIFVAGEIQDQVYKQVITTAADGCKAALRAQKWLESNQEIRNIW